VRLVVVGRVRGPLARLLGEYEARTAHYWKLDVVEVDAGAPGGRDDPDQVRAAEAERVLARLDDGTDVVALTREGRALSSRDLAELLGDAALHARDVTFVIGGAHGLAAAVLERARHRLSLSALTLPHEMARLALTEQLYRAGTILRGEPYHKGP
jgi:23S rRNA (pseudouridine1915-N3)-methyltransferase